MDDLDALEALLAEATDDDFPVPWRVEEVEHYVTLCDSHGYAIDETNFPRTARLIAAARNALPDLLAELRRLRRVEAENAFLREWLRGELTLADVDIDAALRAALSEEPPQA